MQGQWIAAEAFPLEGVGAAIPASTADRRNETLGQESAALDERTHLAQIRAAESRELGDWVMFKVPEPVKIGRSR